VYRKAQQEDIRRKYSRTIYSYQYMFTLVIVLNVDIFHLFSEENITRLVNSNNIKYVLKI